MVSRRKRDGVGLIALDWGSSSLRAMLIGADGVTQDVRSSPHGASTLTGGAAAFEAVLDGLIADWRDAMPQVPLLACGMVGSQHGWREVPYLACPADAPALAAAALTVPWRGAAVHLLPGLRCESAAGMPDVMRGEECQVLGALHLEPGLGERSCIVMPGTHSKWAQVSKGTVIGFSTHMTGELYAVLRAHSVLGRLMPVETESVPQAFKAGVLLARNDGGAGLTHQLFSVRTLGLTGHLPAVALPDFMSGLLIGHELRAGLGWRGQARLGDATLVLTGEPALCQRYATAFELFDMDPVPVLPNTSGVGMWRIASQELFDAE